MISKEERNKKVYDFIKGNIINAVIILTAFAYIFYGLVTIQATGLTVWEVLAKAGIGIIVGFIIKECMGENGFNYGYRSEIWMSNRDKYSVVANSANDYIEYVDNFYACEEIEKKKKYRRQNLISAQMRYEWFFDKDGNYLNRPIMSVKKYKKLAEKKDEIPEDVLILTRYQKSVLKRCLNVKIYNLNLFSEYGIEVENDTKKEKTDKSQRRMMFGKNGLFAIVSAVVGAYFIPLLNGWNWALFIQSCVQVCIWIACGALQLYTNFNYVCVEKVAKLKRKSELIIKFKKGCEEGMYKTNPFDELDKQLCDTQGKEENNDEQQRGQDEQDAVGSVLGDSVSTSGVSNSAFQIIPTENNNSI